MSSSGRRKALLEEALRHMDSLYSSALRWTNDPAQAEDLLQEVYLDVYRSIDRFQPGTNLKAWLYAILRNTFCTQLRKKSRGPRFINYDDVEPIYEFLRSAEGPSARTPEEEFFEFSSIQRVVQAIDDVPEPFREAIELVCIEQFSYKEAGEILDVPIGTIMSRLCRGKRLLQSILLERGWKSGDISPRG